RSRTDAMDKSRRLRGSLTPSPRYSGGNRARGEGVSCGRFRFAFTLTEILIVIALIVLVIALAVPAFSFISGSRSVDAGENLVAAMLGRARAEAVRNHHVAGVAFFRDPNQDRSAMALVVPSADANAVAPEP